MLKPQEALTIFEQIARGTDPVTGAELADDHPFQHPRVLRAVFTAVEVLKVAADRETKTERTKTEQPNAGKPWTDEENDQLAKGFDANAETGLSQPANIRELSRLHGRTGNAIKAQLARLGKIEP